MKQTSSKQILQMIQQKQEETQDPQKRHLGTPPRNTQLEIGKDMTCAQTGQVGHNLTHYS